MQLDVHKEPPSQFKATKATNVTLLQGVGYRAMIESNDLNMSEYLRLPVCAKSSFRLSPAAVLEYKPCETPQAPQVADAEASGTYQNIDDDPQVGLTVRHRYESFYDMPYNHGEIEGAMEQSCQQSSRSGMSA